MVTVTNETEFKAAVLAVDPEIIVANNINLTSPTTIGYAVTIRGEPNVSLFWTNPVAPNPNMLIVAATGAIVVEAIILDAEGRDGTLVQINGGSVTMNDGAVLRNVVSTTSQYAIRIGALASTIGGTLIMNGGLITGIDSFYAVFAIGGTVVMNNDAAISDNQGAAIYVADFAGTGARSSLTMTGRSRSSNNQGKQQGGGGVMINADLIMGVNVGDAPVVSGNQTPEYAGGLSLSEGSTLTMRYNAEISGNTATKYAGGVMAQQSTISMHDNASIKNNVSNDAVGGLAGGVALRITTLNMDGNSVISGNTAQSGGGGGVFASTGSGVNMIGNASVFGNRAIDASARGGGVYLLEQGAASTLTMSGNASIYNNSAGNGGGIYIDTATSLVMGVNAADTPSVTGNSATANFGGIFINQGATATLAAQSRIADNTSALGVNGIGNSGTLRISQNIQIADGLYFNSEASAPVIVQALGENASIQLGRTQYIAPGNAQIVLANRGDTYAALTATDIAAFHLPASFPPMPLYLSADGNQILLDLDLVIEVQGASLTIIRIG